MSDTTSDLPPQLDDESKAIIVYGNPIDGLAFEGPFASWDAAQQQAEENVDNDWWVAEMHPPVPAVAFEETTFLPGDAPANYATITMVVRLNPDTALDCSYDELEREALAAAGIPHQPTDESMYLHIDRGVSLEARRLGATPGQWHDPDDFAEEPDEPSATVGPNLQEALDQLATSLCDPDPDLEVTAVDVVPRIDRRYGVDVAHFSNGGFGMSLTRRVATARESNMWMPDEGYLFRATVYLDPDDRVLLADELRKGI